MMGPTVCDVGLEISVRGGGHGVAGRSLTEGGLMIDLRRLNAVSVDPVARTATVGGGAAMSHLDRGTEPYGLMTTGGRVSTTGVGGFILGGGGGWLDRKFGLACDNLLSVELVTADGTVVRASEDEHPELFWALHGAEYLDTFPDRAVDLFCARAGDMIVPSPSQHVLFPQGGAVGLGLADFPLPWRHAPWVVYPFVLWQDPADDERTRRWAHDIRADLKPWSSGAVYLNFIGDEGADRVVAGLGRENFARLAKVKAEYDPENIFHLNHNIKPA